MSDSKTCPHCGLTWKVVHPIENIFCPLCRERVLRKPKPSSKGAK